MAVDLGRICCRCDRLVHPNHIYCDSGCNHKYCGWCWIAGLVSSHPQIFTASVVSHCGLIPLPTQQTRNVSDLPTLARIEEVLAERGLALRDLERDWLYSRQYVGIGPRDRHLFPSAYPPYEYLEQADNPPQGESLPQAANPPQSSSSALEIMSPEELAIFQHVEERARNYGWNCCCCKRRNGKKRSTLYCECCLIYRMMSPVAISIHRFCRNCT